MDINNNIFGERTTTSDFSQIFPEYKLLESWLGEEEFQPIMSPEVSNPIFIAHDGIQNFDPLTLPSLLSLVGSLIGEDTMNDIERPLSYPHLSSMEEPKHVVTLQTRNATVIKSPSFILNGSFFVPIIIRGSLTSLHIKGSWRDIPPMILVSTLRSFMVFDDIEDLRKGSRLLVDRATADERSNHLMAVVLSPSSHYGPTFKTTAKELPAVDVIASTPSLAVPQTPETVIKYNDVPMPHYIDKEVVTVVDVPFENIIKKEVIIKVPTPLDKVVVKRVPVEVIVSRDVITYKDVVQEKVVEKIVPITETVPLPKYDFHFGPAHGSGMIEGLFVSPTACAYTPGIVKFGSVGSFPVGSHTATRAAYQHNTFTPDHVSHINLLLAALKITLSRTVNGSTDDQTRIVFETKEDGLYLAKKNDIRRRSLQFTFSNVAALFKSATLTSEFRVTLEGSFLTESHLTSDRVWVALLTCTLTVQDRSTKTNGLLIFSVPLSFTDSFLKAHQLSV